MPYLACTANIHNEITVETGTHGKTAHFTNIFYPLYNVEVIQLTTIKQCYIYSTSLGAALKCKQYSRITLETVISVKSVNITLNIWVLIKKPTLLKG